MEISKTVLLPAGSKYGLAAGCGGNDTVVALAKAHPHEYVFFANELPDIPKTKTCHRTSTACRERSVSASRNFTSSATRQSMQLVADIAKDHAVPVLMHFQHNTYNMGIERFYKMFEKYPTVNFIGHAQTCWGNIDKNHNQSTMYPKGPVVPGGITDRLLSDYPNMYGDLSAGSGLNALFRDEDHAREFLKRHQGKLLYGSDCDDKPGSGKPCSGLQQLAAVRRLAPDSSAIRKMLYENAARLMRIS